MSSHKPLVLIIEKEARTADTVIRLAESLDLQTDLAQTHANATRTFAAQPVGIVFFNPTMNMIDPKALIDEFHSIAVSRKRRPAPVVFMVNSTNELEQSGLKAIPGTGLILKPIKMEQVYLVLDKLGMTKLSKPEMENTGDGKIKAWTEYAENADAWMDKLRGQLIK